MKKSSQEHKVDGRQELERFKMASARLVQRAEKDPSVARAFMRETGYFAMMSQTSQCEEGRCEEEDLSR